jgi:hypothetical protein
VEVQPYVASGQGKGRRSSSISIYFLAAFDACRLRLVTLLEQEGLETLEPERLETLFGLLLEAEDRLRFPDRLDEGL